MSKTIKNCLMIEDRTINSSEDSQVRKFPKPKTRLPLERKKVIVELWDSKRATWKFSTLLHRFPVIKHPSDLTKWRKHISQGDEVNKFTKDIFLFDVKKN